MKEIPLTQGKVALVDDEDFEKVNQFKWHAHHATNGRWYARRNIHRGEVAEAMLMHRFIMGFECGDPRRVDHRDRESTLDNRRPNLRVATHAQNNRNVGKLSRNKSGFKGVSWDTERQMWLANISVDGRNVRLGRFASPIEAAEAYDTSALQYHGEFACTNASLGLLRKPPQSVEAPIHSVGAA